MFLLLMVVIGLGTIVHAPGQTVSGLPAALAAAGMSVVQTLFNVVPCRLRTGGGDHTGHGAAGRSAGCLRPDWGAVFGCSPAG